MRLIQKLLVVALPILFGLSSGTVSALVFNYTFSNVSGNVPGTVTGRILGLTEGLSSATAVYIDSYPVGLPTAVLGATPINVMDWNSPVLNVFSVSSGLLVDASFYVFQVPEAGTYRDIGLNVSGSNFLHSISEASGTLRVLNDDGMRGLTIASAIPEPEIYAMMLAGLGLLGWVGRWKKLKERAAA